MEKNKLLLVDGNSILNRAFYGLPELTTKDGRHTNAVLGFLNIVLKVMDEEQATNLCVAFDVKKKNFRHDMYAEYKGTRKPMPDELREQLPLIKDVLKAMHVAIVEQEGYEADDLLGTLSRMGQAQGYQVTVLSGDRDLLQLATDDILIRIPKTKAGKTVIENYHADDVKALYGVDPITFIDMKGLMGDTSDNIPGVPGVGEKTAQKLLVEYGSLDGVYSAVDSMKKSKLKDNLCEFKEQAYLSRQLATIRLDCEIAIDLKDSAYNEPFNAESYEIFKDLELKSHMHRFQGVEQTNDVLKADAVLVEDFDAYNDLMKQAKRAALIGFSYIGEAGNAIGASVCLDGEKAYVIRFVNFVTDSLFADSLLSLCREGLALCCLDVKSQLPYVELSEDYNIFDCGVAAYLLNPLKDKYDYDDIADTFLDISVQEKKELVGKKHIDENSFDDKALMEYFAYLSIVPAKATEKIKERLIECEMYQLYTDIEYPCVFSLYDMEKNGIRVDKAGLKVYGDRLKDRIAQITTEIYELCGCEFNINSTRQLGEILFEKLGLKSGKKTKTGYSTNVEVLEKIAGEHPVIPLILEYRQLTKLNSTYVEGLSVFIGEDGRIHGKFNQTVTATGRISSTEPNLQNIPTRLPLGREIRKVFVPEDGYTFLDADYSQIELRVLAHLSGDATLIDAYNKDSDIHAITASEVFDVPLEKVDSLMRRKAKAVNFGIVYGISSFGLGQDLDISRKEAEGYIQKYFNTYGRVKEFLDKAVADAKEKGYSLTMFNRRRPIPELASGNFMTKKFGERAAMNSPVQGTAADIIKIAMIRVNKELKKRKLKSRLVLQIHDELLVETHLDELDEVKEIMVSNMMEAASLAVNLIVDIHSGNSWYEAK
ncbi:MAG: DNA polymerase I [Clostridium sp.]|nr:DNA polymerase I [Clostridium sp.]MCM1398727.1 DNA polymerase I [Clostridium sp.]MCM1458641.1 DNA polymerase I [Bacteroides sp.]